MLAKISPDRALEIVRANAVRRAPDRLRLDAADGAILSQDERPDLALECDVLSVQA